jgi:hypothetical protein
VPVGTTVSYGYDVTNTGASPIPSDDVLDQVVLLDTASPPQPSWVSPTYTGGDDEGNGMLDRVWTYECSAAANVDTTNIAGVTAIGGSTLDPPLAVQVFSLAGAFVGVFDPGIAITKTADPMFLIGGGDVTDTSEVTNTGDVALTNVAAAIGDNTCSPVTYVSGDIDNDGLLDTPNSIFEDSAEETWIFTCAASVTQTTTNVVDVSGTPVDAGGTDLCASESPRIASGCDVTTQATAVVEVAEPGQIIIAKQTTAPSDQAFEFTSAMSAASR